MTHWMEYAMEGSLLGLFMLSACSAVVVFNHPGSPVRKVLPGPGVRRGLIGVLMGLTAISLIYSPWGQRSGAHLNPAVTLTFALLGKVEPADAAGYIMGQFAGACAGVLAARLVWGSGLFHESVKCAVTEPGRLGAGGAWLGEFAISAVMMTAVLHASNSLAFKSYTGVMAGALVATFILIEAPLSGMSMNPARTLGSALHARVFKGLWVYFTAPPLGMLCAALAYTATQGAERVYCCKLAHPEGQPCLFRCREPALLAERESLAPTTGVSHDR